MLKLNINSLNTKIFLSFFVLAIILLIILFLQIIPNIEKQEKSQTLKQIENMIYLTNQQLKLVSVSIKNNGEKSREELKAIMEHEANRILKEINYKKNNTLDNSIHSLISRKISCNSSIIDKNYNILTQLKKESFKNIKNVLNLNGFTRIDEEKEYVCPGELRKFFYSKKINFNNNFLVISCNIDDFKTTGFDLEKKIKKDIQNSFSKMENFHKGKTYLMWINLKNTQNSKKPLFEKTDNDFYNKKYCLSKISNFRYPKTGLLTGMEILQAADKKAIKHLLNSETNPDTYNIPTFTWIRTIDFDDKERFLYITSIYEEDLFKHINSSFLKILPTALISLLITMIIVFFIIKKIFRKINTLTDTAIKVNNGEINLRNNIQGKDDIAILAKAFDKMLDSIENNIYELDKKVEEKTKQLSLSLKEKEILLKEIHHRVKNNLAITINLIKLEKSKIKNPDTISSLSNIQERVFVMELLHRKLYQSKDFNFISSSKYFEELIYDLKSTYCISKNISIKTDIQNINLNIDYALPCGLIITELITNSFKYAFVNKKEGYIHIKFKIHNNFCTLIINDNGKGLDKDMDINNTDTLGLQIVSNIIKGQLFGDFIYEYKNGSKFIINFKVKL